MMPSLRPLLLLTLGSLATLTLAESVVQQPFLAPEARPVMPPSSPFTTSPSNLADVLTQSRRSSIFYDYCRDVSSASLRLVAPALKGNTTLLVPVNSAIIAMSRKPHQGPPTVSSSSTLSKVAGQVGAREEEDQASKYLERWVKAHMIDGEVDLGQDGWQEKEWTTMDGSRVQFKTKEGDAEEGVLVMPGQIEVVGMDQASNGRVYYLAGTLNVNDPEQ